MEPDKTIRYAKDDVYFTEGTEGVIFRNYKANTVTRLVKISKSEIKYDIDNKWISEWLIMMKMYSLAPDNIPKIYDCGFLTCNGSTSSRTYIGKPEVVMARLKDKVCAAIVMDYIQPGNVPYNTDWSIITQLFWVAHCVNQIGFVHRDMFWRNIIISNTDKKYIMCGDTLIPSNGYEVKVLDWGEVGYVNSYDSRIDMYNIINIMMGFIDYIKFVNGQQIPFVALADIVSKMDGAPTTLTNTLSKYDWYILNKPEELLKVEFGDKYLVQLERTTRYPVDDLNNLLMMNTPLDCFNYCVKKLDGVKSSPRVLNLKPIIGNVDSFILAYFILRVNSPLSFARIKYIIDNKVEYEELEKGGKLDKRWIDDILGTLDKWDIVIGDFESYVAKDGRLIIYNIQNVEFGDNKKCKLYKWLVSQK